MQWPWPEAFLSNPINAFKLIKRSVDEWPQITEYVRNNTQLHALKLNLTNLNSQIHLPDSRELKGAAKGLGRIQAMYNLNPNDLANGVFNDKYYGTVLSVSDCFEIGANLFEATEYHLAIDWFELVLEYLRADENTNVTDNEIEVDIEELTKIAYFDDDLDFKHKDYKIVQENNDEDDYEYDDEELLNEVENMLDTDKDLAPKNGVKKSISPADVDSTKKSSNATFERGRYEKSIFIETLEYLSLAKYELGLRKEAISYTQQILGLYPEHTFKDMEIYMTMKEPKHETHPESIRALQNRTWFSNYTRLCQGKQLPQKDFQKLTCTLDTFNHPQFILAPLKRELLLADPEVVVYHGLLSDTQMLDILAESSSYMKRSKVGIGGIARTTDVRVSQFTRLKYNSSTLKYIFNTVSAISGYNLTNAEKMQVVNYGIGGQYDPHCDFTLQPYEDLIGDRMSTHLFYILFRVWVNTNSRCFLKNKLGTYEAENRVNLKMKANDKIKALKYNLTNLDSQIHLPDRSELQGAAKGLGRIQSTYNLNPNDLAKGVINDKYYGTELSVSDCFEIGANLFEAREYQLAIDWFELVLKYLKATESIQRIDSKIEVDIDELKSGYLDDLDVKYNTYKSGKKKVQEESDEDEYDKKLGPKNEVKKSISLAEIDSTTKSSKATTEKDRAEEKIFIETLEYLSLVKYELGQREEAISYIHQILDIYPEHSFKDMEIYMSMTEPENERYPESITALHNNIWFANYTRLCQGNQLPQKDFHKLTCTLDTLNHPLFILAPLKRELLLADPEVLIYYDLLSDTQILNILEESSLHMYRSNIFSGTTLKVSDVRVSQQARLKYNSSTLKYIYNTVSAISGYNLTNAEDMQVVNYGIGGQFNPHYDFIGQPYDDLIGDRMSTHLFYISDVDQGGNTVFPFLNVYSKPVKGSMLMWHNLHKSLDPDYLTFHGGCPVIMGTKRITNVWVHSGYQEHKRPCDVIRDDYKSLDAIEYLWRHNQSQNEI